MARLLYTIGIQLYGLVMLILQWWHPKARMWVLGRKDQWSKIKQIARHLQQPIWVHCSSLGEFEQGRPVIEALRQNYPKHQILLTFFSPSGYEIRKNYGNVDAVIYLPLDSPANARRFISLLEPQMAIFVKYDFWFNYLNLLEAQSTPYFFISSKFRKSQYLFWPALKPLLGLLKRAEHIFLQDSISYKILKDHQFENISVVGDTRIDRVLTITKQLRENPALESFLNNRFTILFGSIWKEDMEKVGGFIRTQESDDIRFIIAPHDISDSNLQEIEQMIGRQVIYFSDPDFNRATNVVLVNTIGDLAFLYHLADLAYIGGGFGEGIHNILEPAAHGIPVIFGPNYHKFMEAMDLIRLNGVFTIKTEVEFKNLVNHLRDKAHRRQIQDILATYFEDSRGATDKIISYFSIKKLLN